jgi:hypothetical protein
MPSKSPAQARLMRAVSHGWHKPGGGGPSVAVAKEFVAADKAKKKGHRSKEQRADRKRHTSAWAAGKGRTYASPEDMAGD